MINHLRTTLIGLCMGIADLIPGVSGGTIAFIGGIYEQLLATISSFNKDFFILFFTGKWKKARDHCNGTFLVSLFAGIFIALILGSGLIHTALETYPTIVQMFFLGLIVASVLALLKEHPLSERSSVGWFIGGLLLGMVLTVHLALTLPNTLLGLFIAGVLGSVAMILPGISGSYILLLFGAYERVIGHLDGLIEGVSTWTVPAIMDHLLPVITVGVGIVVGLLAMGTFLQWLMKKYHDQVIVLLLGLMVGALPAMIPTKQALMDTVGFSSVFFLLGAGLIWIFFTIKRNRKNT